MPWSPRNEATMTNFPCDAEANLLDADLFPASGGPPHELFDVWREADPVHWNPPVEAYNQGRSHSLVHRGFWVLTRYQDVFEVSRDQSRFTSHDEGFLIWDLDDPELARQQANFMGMRPDDHQRMRHLVMPPFSPKAMVDLKPRIDQLAKDIINSVQPDGSCEFVFDVASKLPVYTFCEIMGIPESMRDRVVALGNAMADVENAVAGLEQPAFELFAICQQLCEEKRRTPDQSLLSELVHQSATELDQMNINMFFLAIAVAGHETTRSAGAHFIQMMNEHPDQYQLLRSDVDRYLPNAIEEVLRFHSPTTQFRRTATLDTDIGGVPVRKGDKIYMSYAAANRDPEVFANPHDFDITRENARKHLAFGTGPHVCLGARLARLELAALLREILEQIPDIRISGEVKRLRSIWFDAIVQLPVTYTNSNASEQVSS